MHAYALFDILYFLDPLNNAWLAKFLRANLRGRLRRNYLDELSVPARTMYARLRRKKAAETREKERSKLRKQCYRR